MSLSKKTKKAGMLLLTAVVIVSIFAGMMEAGLFTKTVKPTPTYPTDHLDVDASYLLKTDETNESVNVSCDLFLTNIWEKKSGEIKATAYVSEQNTNFAVYKTTVEFGVIDANSTKELNIPVKLSDSSYKVEILLFENDKLVKKIKLSIKSYRNYYYDSQGNMTIEKGRSMDNIEEDGQWSITNEKTEIESIH
ncbi:MAG: hypothetical protein V5A64_03530 [Candidatus Thermoplasmatota archaeon]